MANWISVGERSQIDATLRGILSRCAAQDSQVKE